MNQTTILETRLRNLTRLIARTREVAAQQAHLRDTSIRRFGLAHPRTIHATRRLNDTENACRSLMQMNRTAASDLGRRSVHKPFRD